MVNQYQKEKLRKILIISGIAIAVVSIIIMIVYIIMKNNSNKQIVSYDDTIIGKNYFVDIIIDTEAKTIKRDKKETTLQEEFGISDSKAEIMLYSPGDVISYFENSTVEVELDNTKIHLKNPYQTKTLIVEADEIEDNFDAIEELPIQEGIYLLKYDTQKRTKAAYEYLQNQNGIKKVEIDEVSFINTINDESQTVYGSSKSDKSSDSKDYGVSAMGIDKYKKLIKENGNTSSVTVATIGYGAAIENTYFKGKISDDYYNFIAESGKEKDIHESIPQGSRMLEVINESTTDNIKILPIVVINDEQYTTTSAIMQALILAADKADVICYEFVHNQNYMIDLCLQNVFKSNVPVCCVTKMEKDNEEIYPANNATTIAVSSIDKAHKTTSYSGSGEYIDFVASSTDVEEIFNASASVSKWSGAGYSNAHIASIIALIKTYNKDFTILDVYNTIRNFCEDLGSKGKDNTYGYGFPNFSKIKMSDIDKKMPQINEINVDNEKWEKSKQISMKASDNIRIYGWNITKSKDVPKEWNKPKGLVSNLSVSDDIKENGTYYIWVTDSAGNVSYLNKEINKIDIKAPNIQYTIDDSKKDTEKYITINVSATDEESGLHEMAYSWDKQSWGADSNILKVTENGTYTIYVRDKLENIAEKKIEIKNFPKEGVAETDIGNIIKEIKVSEKWEGNTNSEVIVTLNNNLGIEKWKITKKDEPPAEFIETQSNEEETSAEEEENQNQVSNTTSQDEVASELGDLQGYSNVTITVSLEAKKKYYVWIKDRDGNVTSQGFKIKKVE